MNNVIYSAFLRLSKNDFVRGLVVAVLASVFTTLGSALTNNGVVDWNFVLKVAEASAMGYLGKNLLTDSQGKILGKI